MGDVSPAPFGFELHRRWPMFDPIVTTIADNSGATAPTTEEPMSLTTGGLGINKTQEYGALYRPTTTGAISDMFANHGEASDYGLWNRDLLLTCFMKRRSYFPPLTATMYVGCGIGSYAAPPPDPATTLVNVVRLVMHVNTVPGSWELIVHPGDGVSAQTRMALTGVNLPTWAGNNFPSKTYRAQIFVKAGQYVAAAIDGVEGARITSAVPVPGLVPSPDNGCMYSFFVTSGSDTGNVRGDFGGTKLEVFGKA